MSPEHDSALRRRETRRQFIKKTAAAAAAAGFARPPIFAASGNAGVSIVLDSADGLSAQVPVQWAAGELREALAARGINATLAASLDDVPPRNECVFATGSRSHLAAQLLGAHGLSLSQAPESLALAAGQLGGSRHALLAAGSDARGLAYALMELADRVNHAANPLRELSAIKPVVERPANSIRAISRLFASNVEDLSWFNDRGFWQSYLTMLAANRFNRFNLALGLGYDFTTDISDCYFHFAYPFLLAVPGYDVRAVPLPEAERDANLEMLRFISDEAARRGLQFQLGIWTHAYEWTRSPNANYLIKGLTPVTQGPYCRDALRLLLSRCPNITGVTIRTHGESGVAEGDTEIWSTIFSGAAQCGRKVELDLHAKGINQAIIDAALATGMPVTISPKFWAEHMGLPYMQGGIRATEMPPRGGRQDGFFSRSSGARSFMRYGYGDLLDENRRYGVLHRIWPGTQRVLLWGDPEFAASYGRAFSFCGSSGVEILESVSFKGRKGSGLPGGRDAYADATLKPPFDFQKYEYSYRVWGRNLYNPSTDGEGWRRWLRRRFDRGADAAESALSSAGKILPLVTSAHCPSAANNLYWPEMYWNMGMSQGGHKHPYGDTPSPKRFGTVSPLDPEFFLSCDEFASELLKDAPSGKKSPAWAAARLDECAEQASSALRGFKVRGDSSADFRRLKADVMMQAALGKFFAAKFRAGVFYSLYLATTDSEPLREALRENQSSRAVWAGLANGAAGLYRNDVTYGPDYYQRGHWLDRLAAMDDDLARMEKLLGQSGAATKTDWQRIKRAIDEASKGKLPWTRGRPNNAPAGEFHTPPASFQRGRDLMLTVRAQAADSGVQLRYRRVNQSELWQEIPMHRASNEFHAAIPASYADSPFPLQYYFRIHLAPKGVALHPGLERPVNGQPYYVVRQA
ncbi:MAG TPA: twin-arginine translocation signal domain-containing protein [Verrucomicrobiae bacterium]|jgi:hypothetical protein